jgi:hypothetical protein
MKLTLPFPPSVNTYWRAPNKGPLKGRHMISEAGRRFQSDACAAIIEQLRRCQSHQVLCVLWKFCCTRQTTAAGTSTTTPKGCLTR